MSQFVYPQEVSPFIGTFSSYPWTFQDKGTGYPGLDFQCLNDMHADMLQHADCDSSCSQRCNFSQLHQTQAFSIESTPTESMHGSSPEYSITESLLVSRSSSSCSIDSSVELNEQAADSSSECTTKPKEEQPSEFSDNILKHPPILPSQTSSNRRLIFVSKICPLCGKSFTRRSTLQIHLLIHTNLKPFKCSFCDKEFNVKSNLNRHERIHRQKGSSPVEAPQSPNSKLIANSPPYSYHKNNNSSSKTRKRHRTSASAPTKVRKAPSRKPARTTRCQNIEVKYPSNNQNIVYH